MEIRSWLYFILIECVVIQYIDAKSISLNEIIAAESQVKQVTEISPSTRFTDSRVKSITLNKFTPADSQEKQPPLQLSSRKSTGVIRLPSLSKRLASYAKIRKFKADNEIFGDKKISPLKYRKTFLIKSPLKPKKLKISLNSRHKRKNQSTKREISGNEALHKDKYIPLLKSLSMLFDNLLNSDESDTSEIKRQSYKRNRFYSEEQLEVPFKRRSSSGNTKSSTNKKTITPSASFSTEISATAESFTSYENHDDSTYRPHKSIPILLPRDTSGLRRVHHGPGQGSSATYNRDIEGNITRNHGDHEHNTRCTENESCEKSNENNTYSVTRNDASGVRHSRTSRDGNNTGNTKNRETSVAHITTANEDNDATGAVQFEVGRNKTESEGAIREPIRRLRGPVSEDKVATDERFVPELIRPKEIREESFLNATLDSTGHKRITHKNGSFSTENEKVRTGNETVILIERNTRHTGNNSKSAGKKSPVVLIFDGYSVTRDKNGENKVSGKTIHIRS